MKDDDFERVLSRFDSKKKKKSDEQIASETAQYYRTKAQEFRDWLDKPIEDTDFVDVEDWYKHLDEQSKSDASVRKAKGALAAFYDIANKLADTGRIDIERFGRDTPADRAEYSSKHKGTLKSRTTHEDLEYLTPEEVDTLAKATEKLRDNLITRLLFQTGVRVTELCEIRLSDLDREERKINIRGKGRKNRNVYYQQSLDFLMDVWVEERRPAVYHSDSPYLFPTSHSENITRQTVEEKVREAAEEADLQDTYGPNADGHELHTVTPHVLRHSFAMDALNEGWDIYTLSQALGHESTDVTASTYLHDDDDNVRQAFRSRGPAALDD